MVLPSTYPPQPPEQRAPQPPGQSSCRPWHLFLPMPLESVHSPPTRPPLSFGCLQQPPTVCLLLPMPPAVHSSPKSQSELLKMSNGPLLCYKSSRGMLLGKGLPSLTSAPSPATSTRELCHKGLILSAPSLPMTHPSLWPLNSHLFIF